MRALDHSSAARVPTHPLDVCQRGGPMLMRFFKRVLTIAALTTNVVAYAEEPGKIDIEAAEMVAALIGAPVFAKDGAEVGRVADIAFDGELRPKALRMVTGLRLGFGTRTLIIPKGSFIALDGAVVLDVPAEAVAAFAELAEPSSEK